MNIQEHIDSLKLEYKLVGIVDLNTQDNYYEFYDYLKKVCMSLYKESYEDNERLVFYYTKDEYESEKDPGKRLQAVQSILNNIDISNFFVTVITTNKNVVEEYEKIFAPTLDAVKLTLITAEGDYVKQNKTNLKSYEYGNPVPWKISVDQLDEKQKEWLLESKTFCMYPWIHLNVSPDGNATPCCATDNVANGPLGNTHQQTLEEIWNCPKQKQLRVDMLSGTPNEYCKRCYEHEDAGFFSMRQSANKHFGHLSDRVHETKSDGTFDRYEMVYWDIRFSNLCNLRCRSCGHGYSSSWYKDQAALAGPEWAKQNKPLLIAGRDPDDMYLQLIEHIDYVEQIYFAGGEPLMTEEHYLILEELERRERFDVRLIYNTNFTEVKLKNRSVFDYWRKFKSVSVGASLDAMGPHAEYIRKGTKWNEVEQNRRTMLEICPNVDFYISPTLSIMNALHVPDFHKDWVEKGLLNPQDLNINCLLDPPYYRIQVAGDKGKQLIIEKYKEHIEWLRPIDQLQRATIGFESAINFLQAQDKQDLQKDFWKRTNQLDEIRSENILDAIPELEQLL